MSNALIFPPLFASSINDDFSPAYLIAVVLLIAMNGFFVAAEFALVSVRRTRMQELSTEGSRRASMTLSALNDLNQYVSTAQIGITMCSLGIGFLGEPAVAALLRGPLEAIGIQGNSLHIVAFIIAFTLLTFMHVVAGEVAPKNFALQKSEALVLWCIPIITSLRKLFTPLIWVLNTSADLLIRSFGVEPAPGMHMIHSEEELKLLVSQSSKGGILEDSEQEMLYNVFDFADTNVQEVMVPRPDVVGFPVSMPVPELLAAVANQPFTRYPMYRDSMDHIDGILHIRDLFTAAEQKGAENVNLESLLRRAHVVPESKSLARLLADFRRSKSHMALVIDEYGSLAGIVTLEDLIEEIVGEIDDEHDRPERTIERIAEGHFRVGGKFSVEDLNDQFGLGLPQDDYHTIGGVVFGLLGQEPHEGDVVRYENVRMEVVETDGPRIVNVDIIMADHKEKLVAELSLDQGDQSNELIPGQEVSSDRINGGGPFI